MACCLYCLDIMFDYRPEPGGLPRAVVPLTIQNLLEFPELWYLLLYGVWWGTPSLLGVPGTTLPHTDPKVVGHLELKLLVTMSNIFCRLVSEKKINIHYFELRRLIFRKCVLTTQWSLPVL